MINPYTCSSIIAELPEGHLISDYFRINQVRDFGKISFLDLSKDRVTLQALLENSYHTFEKGNLVKVLGTISKNNKGDNILKIKEISLEEKGYPLYDSLYYKLKDAYEYRKNTVYRLSEMKEIVLNRSLLYSNLRNYLSKRGFLQVSCRILSEEYGGANAASYTTKSNETSKEMYLSICPELDLKRYLLAGYSKVFSIHRCFRNESFDRTHHPEFQMIEIYEVGSSCEDMKNLFFDFLINYYSLKEKPTELCFFDKADKTIEDYDKKIKSITGWTVSKGVLHSESPLCKESSPGISDQIEIYHSGLELANIYSEETNLKKLEYSFNLSKGDPSSKLNFLEDFKYQIPKTGGMGIGLDRLLMVLYEKESIEQVLPFIQR